MKNLRLGDLLPKEQRDVLVKAADPWKADGMTLSNIEDAIAQRALGKMVLVVDDEARKNEGDITLHWKRSRRKPSLS